jgi:flap endonuclease-1
MKEQTIKDYTGRKLAIDASMAIYQFLVAVRSGSDGGGPSQQLTNEAGEVTSHLQGFWYRTLKFIEAGIKPVYVFDGKPPELKSGELSKRRAMKDKAATDLAAAVEAGNDEDVERFTKRTVKMDKSHIDDCKRLLGLMGVPVVEAPYEAEAQCAALARAGKVYAAVSEDMDTLTFGAPRLVRKLFASEASMAKSPPVEISLERALEGLGLSMDQFVDVCILSGCDYCDTIKGVASVTALKLVKEHGSLAAVVAVMKAKEAASEKESDKGRVPDVDWDAVRAAFLKPDVADPESPEVAAAMVWRDPDEAGLVQFLVTEKGFKQERIEAGIAKLKKARTGGQQMRLDGFFTKPPPPPPGDKAGDKRKPAASTKSAGGKLTKVAKKK